MADAVVSIVIAFYLPFILIKQKEDRTLSSFTALDLFSVIAAVVAKRCRWYGHRRSSQYSIRA
jgi:hypothetical protein